MGSDCVSLLFAVWQWSSAVLRCIRSETNIAISLCYSEGDGSVSMWRSLFTAFHALTGCWNSSMQLKLLLVEVN
jgi:hypothetical protein